MSPDAFVNTAIAATIAALGAQAIAYRYWKRRGLAFVTLLLFLLNISMGHLVVRSFKLCEPRSPGCEMGGLAVGAALITVIAKSTALSLISAIGIDVFGRRRRSKQPNIQT